MTGVLPYQGPVMPHFSPDGALLVSVQQGQFHVHETAAGKLLYRLPAQGPPRRLSWAGDGEHLLAVTGGKSGWTFSRFEARTGRPLDRPLTFAAPVQDVACSADGGLLAVARPGKAGASVVSLHDGATGAE